MPKSDPFLRHSPTPAAVRQALRRLNRGNPEFTVTRSEGGEWTAERADKSVLPLAYVTSDLMELHRMLAEDRERRRRDAVTARTAGG